MSPEQTLKEQITQRKTKKFDRTPPLWIATILMCPACPVEISRLSRGHSVQSMWHDTIRSGSSRMSWELCPNRPRDTSEAYRPPTSFSICFGIGFFSYLKQHVVQACNRRRAEDHSESIFQTPKNSLNCFGPHRVPERELSELLLAYYLCQSELTEFFAEELSEFTLFRNSALETVFRPFPANETAKLRPCCGKSLRMELCATKFASDCECDGLVHSGPNCSSRLETRSLR